jgi:hypothetical protein
MDEIRIDKLSAASRQIDAAVRLLFSGEDMVAVHTLAGAASTILSDLIEARTPAKSWDKIAQAAAGLDARTYFAIMRRTQNFLKHAKDDPDGIHEFLATDTAGLLMWAIMNLVAMQALTREQQVFQLWFIACHLDHFEASDIASVARRLFKNLSRRSMAYRVAVGRRVLGEQLISDRNAQIQ